MRLDDVWLTQLPSMAIDEFFKLNYRRMVNYVAAVSLSDMRDVEEIVADTIYERFAEYDLKIESPRKYEVMRRWMNRRALLDLRTLYRHIYYSETGPLPQGFDAIGGDDPAELVSLMERLPRKVHPILLEYEQRRGYSDREAKSARQTANNSADKTRFCRERAKFMKFINRE